MSTSAKHVWFEATRFRLSPNDVPRKNNQQLVPQGYLRISEAYDRHFAGIWGGLEQPVPVQAFKAKFKSSARFAGRENYAAQRLTAAAHDGKFTIYVVADPKLAPSIDHPRAAPPPTKDPTIVPISILRRLMTWRDKLPDRAIRPTIKTTGGDLKLFVLLGIGFFVVQEREFARWYRKERSKGKWPSQRSRFKKGHGRLTKQTEPLKKRILALVRDRAWTARDGIAKLRRLLIDGGCLEAIPSPDTLERLIGRLHIETGNPALFRRPRVRRKLASNLPQKSPDISD